MASKKRGKPLLEKDFELATAENIPEVLFSDLLEFYEENTRLCSVEIRGTKNIRSMRTDYAAEAVRKRSAQESGTLCTVKARVTPEYRVNAPAYNIKTVLEEGPDGNTIKECRCLDCAASRGAIRAKTTALVSTVAPQVTEPSSLPYFMTEGQTFKVMAGDSVVLPCEAENTGSFKQAWKRSIAILTAGNVKVSPDSRLRLTSHNYDLEIRNVAMKDAGEYVCQVATLQPMEITHVLEILVPPQIIQVTGGGLLEVKKGTRVNLECKATGNPPPVITWTRKNNLVMAGKTSIESTTLTIEDTTRHHAGVYICSADNGVGTVQTREITLHIMYPPEIDVEKSWVHGGIGVEAHLVCIVHAHPPADVKWYQSTLRLEPTELHRIEVRGSRHQLIFNSVQKEDFSNYTCQADNVQGRTRQYVVLSGKPHQGVIISPDIAKSRDSYNISWTITSYAAIEEYRLYFRKTPLGTVPSNVIDSDPVASKKSLRKSSSHGFKEWTDVVIQGDDDADNEEKSITHEKSYLIRGLEPSTQYEAKLQARNVFGWNQMSDTFRFTTRGMDGISREPTPEAILPEAEMRDLGVKAKDSAVTERACWVLIALSLSLFL